MHDDHRGQGDGTDIQAPPQRNGLLRRLLRLLTFVDLPIKQKFLLLTLGTLFWFSGSAPWPSSRCSR